MEDESLTSVATPHPAPRASFYQGRGRRPFVMPGLFPGTHVFNICRSKSWMAGTSPAMTHLDRNSIMSLQVYLAFVAACVALALLPGPMVTLVIANGLRHGTRAALINIAGAQLGLAIVIGVVAVGLTSLMATMGYWFDWVRFAGAAYLVWLGIKLIRFPVQGIHAEEAPPPPRGGFFLQGLLVLLSNPKVLIFFGAF